MHRMADVKVFVDSEITAHKVVLFAKEHCPFCRKAIAALRAVECDMQVHFIEKETPERMNAIQDYLLEKTGKRSVPRVFVDHKFYGGGDDVVAGFDNKSLLDRLKKIGAVK
eukprot:Polyplicarium_translucidae@DN1684_c0_g1_i2.p1